MFLQQIALVADADTRSDDEGLVTLMTLHNAKGLEYPTVFIAGCEEGVFPHSRALDEGGLEEERRLFYVGVTRAMRELYLTLRAPPRGVRRADATACAAASSTRSRRSCSTSPSEMLCRARAAVAAGRRRAGADGDARAARRRRLGRAGAPAARGARAGPRRPSRSFRLGEDVVHAAFGEGVVTGVEPGGVIVVRFAERWLRAQADGRVRAGQPPLTRADRSARRQRIASAPMSATIIDGKAIAARVRARGRRARSRRSREQHGRAPGLATVLVGEDPASAVYVGGKQRACAEVGMTAVRPAPAGATRRSSRSPRSSSALNADRAVSGILLQLPRARRTSTGRR